VHPKPVAWKTLMQPVADAISELNITSNPIPLAPFSEWLEKLESSAKDSSEETIKRIVSVSFRLNGTFSHFGIIACYQASRLHASYNSIRHCHQSVWGDAI
jgi:hypothetical protein